MLLRRENRIGGYSNDKIIREKGQACLKESLVYHEDKKCFHFFKNNINFRSFTNSWINYIYIYIYI